MTETEYRDLLRTLSVGTGGLAALLPGAAGAVGKVIAAGLALAADFVDAGNDPVTCIEGIRARAPMLKEVEKGWECELEKRFGPAPEAADTLKDIYEDED